MTLFLPITLQPDALKKDEPLLTTALMPRAIVALFSTLLAVLAVEAAARVYARVTRQERGMTFDAELGWRPLPNVSKVGTIWGVSRPAATNSLGWRDRERSQAKPSGALRAVAIGDSLTFGVDVDDGQRFTDRLEALSGIEVINLGVAGYGTDQELRLLELHAFRYQPDIVILTIFLGNDLDDLRYERLYSWPKPYYTLQAGRLTLRKPRTSWDTRVRSASYVGEFLYQGLRDADAEGSFAPEWAAADPTPLFLALLRRIAMVTSEQGARLLAVLAYGPDQIEGEPPDAARHAIEALERAQVPTLDTGPLFRRSGEARRLYQPAGFHWNARGHDVVAAGLRDLIDTRMLRRTAIQDKPGRPQ